MDIKIIHYGRLAPPRLWPGIRNDIAQLRHNFATRPDQFSPNREHLAWNNVDLYFIIGKLSTSDVIKILMKIERLFVLSYPPREFNAQIRVSGRIETELHLQWVDLDITDKWSRPLPWMFGVSSRLQAEVYIYVRRALESEAPQVGVLLHDIMRQIAAEGPSFEPVIKKSYSHGFLRLEVETTHDGKPQMPVTRDDLWYFCIAVQWLLQNRYAIPREFGAYLTKPDYYRAKVALLFTGLDSISPSSNMSTSEIRV